MRACVMLLPSVVATVALFACVCAVQRYFTASGKSGSGTIRVPHSLQRVETALDYFKSRPNIEPPSRVTSSVESVSDAASARPASAPSSAPPSLSLEAVSTSSTPVVASDAADDQVQVVEQGTVAASPRPRSSDSRP